MSRLRPVRRTPVEPFQNVAVDEMDMLSRPPRAPSPARAAPPQRPPTPLQFTDLPEDEHRQYVVQMPGGEMKAAMFEPGLRNTIQAKFSQYLNTAPIPNDRAEIYAGVVDVVHDEAEVPYREIYEDMKRHIYNRSPNSTHAMLRANFRKFEERAARVMSGDALYRQKAAIVLRGMDIILNFNTFIDQTYMRG